MTTLAGFESKQGPAAIRLQPGTVSLVAGPNGVGKSALLHQLFRSLPLGVGTYLPGHRQINLNQSIETLGQDLTQLRQNFFNGWDAFNRYRGAWSEDQFKATLRTLINAEHSFNRAFRQAVATDESAAKTANLDASPIDQLNVIFSHSGLPIRFALTSNGLTAQRSDQEYGVEALSDGERAALFLTAAIITQEPNTVLLIDEPEKHLHPSITGLLLETALRTNGTVAVVVASHDMTLIERLAVQQTIYVRDSEVTSLRPEIRRFDVEFLNEGVIPEQLRIDVLGARSSILYVEGTENSRDAALYAHVYTGWKVISKGGSEKVIEATRGVRSAKELHWLSAAGLVDGDGRHEAEVEKLRSQGILVLPTPTIENLFFIDEAQQCFVEADLNLRGGRPFEERQDLLNNVVPEVAKAQRDQLVARRSLWRVQREIDAQGLSVKDIREDRVPYMSVNIAEIKASVAVEVDALIESGDVRKLLTKLPIKNTDIPNAAARALGATSFQAYCQTVQRQLDLGTDFGLKYKAALKSFLPTMSPESDIPNIHPVSNIFEIAKPAGSNPFDVTAAG